MALTPKARRALLARYLVTDGDRFHLADYRTDDLAGCGFDKAESEIRLENSRQHLRVLQEKLYADGRWGVLLALQGMDAAGKDGLIRHVMSGVNPQGVTITGFKAPSAAERVHDFLWRVHAAVPERGRIGIFNRSHYEEVLVCRVHPELIDAQKLPDALRGKKFWQHRMEDIVAFERYLTRQGIVVRKVFLHLSKAEQARRLLARLDDPAKTWKFEAADLAERGHWNAYQAASEAMIRATATPHAPWLVVPADHKWLARVVVAEALIDAMEALELSPPDADPRLKETIEAARKVLAG